VACKVRNGIQTQGSRYSCGYGLSWQIAPTVLGEMMKDPDRAPAKRVAEAMLKMIKLDIGGVKKAYEGGSGRGARARARTQRMLRSHFLTARA
jgi:hypothetical protein